MASTLVLSGGGGRGNQVLVGDSRVAAGGLVRLGYLTEGTNLSSFVEFGRTTISNPSQTLTIGGFLNGQVDNNDPAANTAAQGKQVVLWIYNAATIEGSSADGVFTSTDASWKIPTTFDGGATQSSNIITGLGTPPGFTNVTALKGSYSNGPITVGTGTNENGSIYTLVPEVSSSLLVGLSALGLMVRRRR